jgi:hypothetical protein
MRLIRRSALYVFALIGAATNLCNYVNARETTISRKIDESTAQRLTAEAFFGADKDLEFFEYDSGVSNDFTPPFFAYYGASKPPAEGSFGVFAVNPWTGDVWNLWGCHRLSTPVLRKSQAAIRRHFTREELKQYARPRRLKPICTVED